MPELDNPQGESAVQTVTESSAAPQAPGSAIVEPAKAAAPAEVEEMVSKKDLDKIQMEANNYKNKLAKFEAQEEEARKANLSEVDRLKEELAQRDVREAQREAKEFRSATIEEYLKDSPAALKAAKALIAKNPGNLVWGDGLTEDEARADLQGQLDALREVVGETKPAETTPTQRSNNPMTRAEPDPDRAALVMEARKTGDFSKLIGSIPSVQEQIKTFDK